jgi:hypothetical protein
VVAGATSQHVQAGGHGVPTSRQERCQQAPRGAGRGRFCESPVLLVARLWADVRSGARARALLERAVICGPHGNLGSLEETFLVGSTQRGRVGRTGTRAPLQAMQAAWRTVSHLIRFDGDTCTALPTSVAHCASSALHAIRSAAPSPPAVLSPHSAILWLPAHSTRLPARLLQSAAATLPNVLLQPKPHSRPRVLDLSRQRTPKPQQQSSCGRELLIASARAAGCSRRRRRRRQRRPTSVRPTTQAACLPTRQAQARAPLAPAQHPRKQPD